MRKRPATKMKTSSGARKRPLPSSSSSFFFSLLQSIINQYGHPSYILYVCAGPSTSAKKKKEKKNLTCTFPKSLPTTNRKKKKPTLNYYHNLTTIMKMITMGIATTKHYFISMKFPRQKPPFGHKNLAAQMYGNEPIKKPAVARGSTHIPPPFLLVPE